MTAPAPGSTRKRRPRGPVVGPPALYRPEVVKCDHGVVGPCPWCVTGNNGHVTDPAVVKGRDVARYEGTLRRVSE